MKKLITTVVLVGGITMGGVTFANENVKITPESELYETISLIVEGNVELTEDGEGKAAIQDEHTENLLDAVESVIETGNNQAIEQLFKDINETLKAIDNIVEEADKIGEDISELEKVITEIIATRSQNLLALLERENLPEQAKAGIRKALVNQEKALQRAGKAKKLWEQVEEAIVKMEEEANVVEANLEAELQLEATETNSVEQENKHMVKAHEKVDRTLKQAEAKIERTLERAQRHEEKGQTTAHEKALEKAERTQQKAQEKVERTLERAAERETKGNGNGAERP